MAVTQQLVRISEGLLDECRHDARRLDDLCSFRTLDATDHLDLDWSPKLLEDAAAAAQVRDDLRAALALATTGEIEVNSAYRDAFDTVWEHPVSYLSASRVADVDRALQALERVQFLSAQSVGEAIATRPLSERPSDPQQYLSRHFHALRTFYQDAAERGLCTVMWWD